MKKNNKSVLIIANYKHSVGGISGQVEILMEKFNFDLFNTKMSNFRRIFLPFFLFVKGINYDTFHIHGCSGLGFFPIIIGVIVGRLLRKKIIVTYHGGGLSEFLNKFGRYIKFILSQADTLTVPSKYLRDIFATISIDAVVLPNIMRDDNVCFKNREYIAPKLVVTRSLEKLYNIELAVIAYSKIKAKYKDASLRIVGDGSQKNNLMKLVFDMKIKDVIFVGRVSNDDIGEELNKSDIFINPTTKDSFGVSMFEAFACGLPVISTAVGAIPDFLTDSYNGLLVENNNIDEMVAAIDRVLNDNKLRERIVFNAYKTYIGFTWHKLRDEYASIYS